MMEACSMVNPAFLVNVEVNDQQGDHRRVLPGNWVTATGWLSLVDVRYVRGAGENAAGDRQCRRLPPRTLNFYQT